MYLGMALLLLGVVSLQSLLAPLFPGLMGVRITEASPGRVVAEMEVRSDLCTAGAILHGGAYMAFADTLGAVGAFINRITQDEIVTTMAHEIGHLLGASVNFGHPEPADKSFQMTTLDWRQGAHTPQDYAQHFNPI